MNGLLRDAVRLAIERLPYQRELRVLEIGAGTGGTTAYLLPILPTGNTDYVYTDISPRFESVCEENARQYPFVRFQTLDIESTPQDQGFEEAQFDLIVAANVLHATSSLSQTLRNVASLLAPGGMLVLLESTSRQRWVDLIFGLTDGWWRFSDHEVRPDYPLVSAEKWQELLTVNGFEDARAITPGGGAECVLAQHSVIMARKKQLGAQLQPARHTHWLIFADAGGLAEQLARVAQNNGEQSTLIYPGTEFELADAGCYINPADPAYYSQVVSHIADSIDSSSCKVVHLWSLDSVATDDLSDSEIQSAFERGIGSALYFVQALVNSKLVGRASFVLVTRGAQPGMQPCLAGLAQSPLWGMAKVVVLEFPDLDCLRIDLDEPSRPGEAEALYEEVSSNTAEDQVIFRDRDRLVPRLVHAVAAEQAGATGPAARGNVSFQPDSTYLITGGLAGVGLAVARWMVDLGARKPRADGPNSAERASRTTDCRFGRGWREGARYASGRDTARRCRRRAARNQPVATRATRRHALRWRP